VSISWLDLPFAVLLGLGLWWGKRIGLAHLILQSGGAMLGLALGRWLITMVVHPVGQLGIPPWLFVGGACLGGALLGAFVANLAAWALACRLAKWAPRTDMIGGAILGLLASALLWGTLYMGLLGWTWQPWTQATHASLSGGLVIDYMPVVYRGIERIFPVENSNTPALGDASR
jgi:hypothetical protein